MKINEENRVDCHCLRDFFIRRPRSSRKDERKDGSVNDVQIISRDKILNTYRIKVQPSKNENLKPDVDGMLYPVIPTLAIGR